MDAAEVERQLSPGFAEVGREPHVAVGQPGVEMAGRGRVGEQGVGHVVERVGQAAGEFFKCLPVLAAKEVRLCLV